MSHKSSHSTIILSLISVVILSLILVWSLPIEKGVSAEDIQRCIDESLSEEPGDSDFMKQQAYELATVLFDDPAQCESFANEVTEIYFASINLDFLLVYNTGGFGGGTIEDDPEWPSILEGIERELADLGNYKSMVIEYQRGKGGTTGFLREVEEVKNNYSSKAPELAARIAFLTKYNPKLKVITTGRCFGAIISNEVMEIEAANPRVYSIQAGRPWWYIESSSGRSLVIDDNGETPDTLSRGDFWAIARANINRLPSAFSPLEGGFKILNWYFKAPGHTYTWNYPRVQSEVSTFLKDVVLQ